jgi:hypothetical protein
MGSQDVTAAADQSLGYGEDHIDRRQEVIGLGECPEVTIPRIVTNRIRRSFVFKAWITVSWRHVQ